MMIASPNVMPLLASGLRAKSARAVTGRRYPHNGEGENFLTGQPDNFTKTAVTPERKVEKLTPRWEINRRPSCQGLKMGHRPKLGSYGKNQIF